MSKLNIQKLASTFSGRERAKLLITSWGEASTDEETLSEADRRALMQFDESQTEESHEYRYYMALYKHAGLLCKEAIKDTSAKIMVLGAHLQEFRTAIGIDGVLKLAIIEIQKVPIFVSETEFKQKREEELSKQVGSIADFPSETDKRYAISYDPEEIELSEGYKPSGLAGRESLLELCRSLQVVEVSIAYQSHKLSINEQSGLLHQPQEVLRGLELRIQELMTYRAVVEQIESLLDGVSLFDQVSYKRIKQEYDYAEKLIDFHNERLNKLETDSALYPNTELVDKEKYLLKRLPISTEERDNIIKIIKDRVQHETGLIYT
jgi:hypothetical protein